MTDKVTTPCSPLSCEKAGYSGCGLRKCPPICVGKVNAVLAEFVAEFVAALAPDPAAKKLFFALAVKLNDKDCDRWYRCFFYNMRVEMERFAHHKYVPDSYPVPIMEGLYE